MGMFRSAVFAALLLLTSGNVAPLPAQQATSAGQAKAPAATGKQTPVSTAPSISVDARLVNIPVVVRDKRGSLVQNLTKDNFILQVDGHPQTIRYFNLDTDLPLTLGLLVDTSIGQRDAIDGDRTASSAFLENMLIGPANRDQAFVVQFARQTDLLQDVTNSKPKLQAALKQLAPPSFGGGSSGNDNSDRDSGSGASGRTRRRGGATLYDALFLSSDEIIGKQKGRKALIILSNGDDNGSKESLTSSIEAAQRADTIVYAIYFKGREMGGGEQDRDRPGGGRYPGGRGGGGHPGVGLPGDGGGGGQPGGGQRRQPTNTPGRPDGKKILQRMADETGGRLFEVTRKQTLTQVYTSLGEELRAQYRLGYTPDEATASEGYHQIDLSLTKSRSSPRDVTIQTRDGYYAGK